MQEVEVLRFLVACRTEAERCMVSMASGVPIAISGVSTDDGQIRVFKGIVRSVEEEPMRPGAAHSWRVTLSPVWK